MKTIAQQMNAKEFPFSLYDVKGNTLYYENSSGDWYREEYDEAGNQIYYESSNKCWHQREFDELGNVIYFVNSDGYIRDNKPIKEVTMQEVEKKFGCTIKIIK